MLINKITKKEVQVLYGLSPNGAHRRLNAIRSLLNKKRHHNLTVIEFCRAEDISLTDFDMLMQRAMQKQK